MDNEFFVAHFNADLVAHLEDKDVLSIMLNPDGSLWIDTFTSGKSKIGSVDPIESFSIIDSIARSHGHNMTPASPIFDCELPDGSLFAATIPPISKGPTFIITKKVGS